MPTTETSCNRPFAVGARSLLTKRFLARATES